MTGKIVGASKISVKTAGASSSSSAGGDTDEAFLIVSQGGEPAPGTRPDSFTLSVWMLQQQEEKGEEEQQQLYCWQGSISLSDLQFLECQDQDALEHRTMTILSRSTTMTNTQQDSGMNDHDDDKNDAQIETQWSLSSSSSSDLAFAIVDRRSGLKKFRVKGSLVQQQATTSTISNSNSNSNGTSAATCSYAMLQRLHGEIVTAREALAHTKAKHETEITSLRQAAEDYKKTADDLEGVWDKEKTQLLQNFLKAYNARADLLRKQTEEIQLLREQLAEAQQQSSSSSTKQPKAPSLKRNKLLDDVPQDAMDIDEDEVDRLAGDAAPKRSRSAAKTATTKKNNNNNKKSPPKVVGQMRVNPITGAKEYTDADIAIEDAFKDIPNATNKKSKAAAKKVKSEPANSNVKSRDGRTRETSDSIEKEPNIAQVAKEKAATKTIKTESESDKSKNEEEKKILPQKKMRRPIDSSSDSDSSGPAVRRRVKVESSQRRRRQMDSSSDDDSDDNGHSNPRRKGNNNDKRQATALSGDSSQPTSKAPRRSTACSSSDTDDDHPATTRRTKPISPVASKSKNDDNISQQEVDKDDESDTEDEVLKNIRSQIALLKEQEDEESD